MDIRLRVLKESNKSRFDSYIYSVRKSVLIISDITLGDCRLHIFPTTFIGIFSSAKEPWEVVIN